MGRFSKKYILEKLEQFWIRLNAFFVEHEKPIAITLVLHIFIIMAANFIHMRYSPRPQDRVFNVNFSEELEPRPELEEEQDPKEEDYEYQERPDADPSSNKASNMSIDPEIAKLRARMSSLDEARDITSEKTEEGKEVDLFSSSAEKRDVLSDLKDEPVEESEDEGELQKEIYTGSSTINYDLKDRYELRLPNPIYTCIEGGTVVVNITVDQEGHVKEAGINKRKSKTNNQCLWETALEYARRARFNTSYSAPKSQKGTISYQFQMN